MIISRGPRLFRNFQRQQPQPAPIAIDQDEMQRRLDILAEEIEQIEEGWQLENEDLPELPDGADPDKLIFDEEAR